MLTCHERPPSPCGQDGGRWHSSWRPVDASMHARCVRRRSSSGRRKRPGETETVVVVAVVRRVPVAVGRAQVVRCSTNLRAARPQAGRQAPTAGQTTHRERGHGANVAYAHGMHGPPRHPRVVAVLLAPKYRHASGRADRAAGYESGARSPPARPAAHWRAAHSPRKRQVQ